MRVPPAPEPAVAAGPCVAVRPVTRHNVRPELLETADLVPVDSLGFYPGNPRQHADDELVASLVKHGQYKTVGVHRSTRHVLMGNGTFANIIGLGWTHVAVHWIDCSDIEAAQIVATDNRLSDLGRDDPGLLHAHLARLAGDLPVGFDDDFVAVLAASNAEPLHFDDTPAPYCPRCPHCQGAPSTESDTHA